ncbi:MAG: tetratricopeptide repeat protein [bacterium]|nr:tetratricopeptide repeat protein [bacterium]
MRWLLVLSIVLLGAAQDPERDGPGGEGAFRRQSAYLARNPFHAQVFDGFLAACRERGIDGVLADYRARIGADPDSLAPRVVAARLCAALGRVQEALALLEGARVGSAGSGAVESGARLQVLRARLWLEYDAPARALAALAVGPPADAQFETRKEWERQRAEAHLLAGDERAATVAIEAYVAHDPEGYHARVEAGEWLAGRGVVDAALAHFAAALDGTSGDPEREVSLLVRLGELHERRAEGREAIARYRAALAKMGCGHWRLEDLHGRILRIHVMGGELEALIAEWRALLASEPSDVDLARALAKALERAGDERGALRVVRGALDYLPDEVALRTVERRLLCGLEEWKELVRVDQALLAAAGSDAAGRDVELELELAGALFEIGRAEAASARIAALLEARPDEVPLRLRVARTRVRQGESEAARAAYAQALERAPTDVPLGIEVMLFEREHAGDAPARVVLESVRGGVVAAGKEVPARLTALADACSDQQWTDDARALLVQALEIEPCAGNRWLKLAELELKAERIDAAADAARAALTHATEGGVRRSGLDLWFRVQRRVGASDAAIAGEVAKLVGDPTLDPGGFDVAAHLIAASGAEAEGDFERAAEILTRMVAARPDDVDVHRRLASAYEDAGLTDTALGLYTEIAERFPARRREVLGRIVALRFAARETEAFGQALEELGRESRGNAAALREVAGWHREAGELERAAALLRRATRLQPEESEYRVELARVLLALGDETAFRRELFAAHRVGDADQRRSALKELFSFLGRRGRLDAELERLEARLASHPYDLESARVLVALLERGYEVEKAHTVVDRLLAVRPFEPDLLRTRARLAGALGAHMRAAQDFETLRRLPAEAGADVEALDLVRAYASAGKLDLALELSVEFDSPIPVARAMWERGHTRAATELLREHVVVQPEAASERLLLAEMLSELGRFGDAIPYAREAAELRPDVWRLRLELARMMQKNGDGGGARRVADELFDIPSARAGLERLYRTLQVYDGWLSKVEKVVREAPDFEAMERGVALLSGSRQSAPGIERTVDWLTGRLEAGEIPDGHDADSFAAWIEGVWVRYYTRNPHVLQAEYTSNLGRAKSGKLDARGWTKMAIASGVIHTSRGLQKPDFAKGLGRAPRSPILLSVAARDEMERGDWDTAITHLVTLRDVLAPQREALRREREQQVRGKIKELAREGFAGDVPEMQRVALRKRAARLLHTSRATTYFGQNRFQYTWLEATHQLAEAYGKLGRPQLAHSTLAGIEPEGEDDAVRWLDVANTAERAGLAERAQAIREELLALRAELLADPHLRACVTRQRAFRDVVGHGVDLHERGGELAVAYELARTSQSRARAKRLLDDHAAAERLIAAFDVRRVALGPRIGAGATLEERSGFWNVCVMTVEIRAARGELDAVRDVLEQLAERFGDAYEPHVQLAELARAAGEWDVALAHLEHARASLAPEAPGAAPRPRERRPGERRPEEVALFALPRAERGRTPALWAALWKRAESESVEVALREMRVHLERGDAEAALALLARLVPDPDAGAERWAGLLLPLLHLYALGDSEARLAALLHHASPEDGECLFAYTRALSRAGDDDRARGLLVGFGTSRRLRDVVQRGVASALAALE